MSANRPAPAFRPKGYREQQRQQRRRRLLYGGVAAAVAIVLVGGAVFALVSGGDDAPAAAAPEGSPTPFSTGGTEGGPSPVLEAPASRYVPEIKEVPSGYDIYPPDTYALSPLAFAGTAGLFSSAEEGEATAEEWGYVDGFQATYQPIGLLAEVLKGKYYSSVSTYLFETEAGAQDCYERFESFYATLDGSEREAGVKGLGNQSSAWRYPLGTVASSDVDAVYHRFIFRRGNMVTAVQTYGAVPFMTIDRAREIAITVDERALGNRPAPTPTPARSGTPALPAASATP